MTDDAPLEVVRPLLRVRQTRAFSDTPVDRAALDAIADAARWSGSSRNGQPWRFVVIRSPQTLAAIANAGMPQTRAIATATAAIAIVMPNVPGSGISTAYDEGRAAERILVAASLLGLGAGIAWVRSEARPAIGEILGVPVDRFVRTMVAIGHASDEGKQPKSAPGEARLPRRATVMEERWTDEGGSD